MNYNGNESDDGDSDRNGLVSANNPPIASDVQIKGNVVRGQVLALKGFM